MSNEEMQQVSADELLSQLSGSSNFGKDELIKMFAYQDDQGKDFCIHHRQKAFCVPLDKIREFFTRHPKPVPPMTKDQELVYLREKVQKLQGEAEVHQGMDKVARPAPDVSDEPEEAEKIVNPMPDDLPPEASLSSGGDNPEASGGQDAPVVEEKPIAPKRDEGIPPPEAREKMSLKEVRASLAKELKDKKIKPAKQKLMDNAQPKDIARAPKE